jgi:hypothetical protein
MKRLAVIFIALAAALAASSMAQAADGCGRGWYWNGYRCAPMRVYGPPRYGYYEPAPRYYGRYRAYPYRPGHNYGSAGCPWNYTVQDGVCKPYRGY